MTIHVLVTLDPNAFGLPSATLLPGPTFEFDVSTTAGDDAICEEVFAICNSYPEELHCERENARLVGEYRSRKLRSLWVGDTVALTSDGVTRTYKVAGFGFDLVTNTQGA